MTLVPWRRQKQILMLITICRTNISKWCCARSINVRIFGLNRSLLNRGYWF